VRPPLRWFVPDLALIASAVALFYCLFLARGYQQLFRDSDAGWHIRTGERILRGEMTDQTKPRSTPDADPYSSTRAGQPSFAWEWGADVITGAIHRAAGLRGVALLYGAIVAAGVWLWFRLHWAVGGDFFVACAMAPLMLTTCGLHWLARPHVIGWLFLLVTMLWVERLGARGQGPGTAAWRTLLLIAFFSAAWANLHASFFLAPVISLVYGYPRVAIVAAVAPLANPYGWRLYEHVFRYLTDSQLLSRIGEFQSFDFHRSGSGQVIAALIVAIAGGALALARRRYDRYLLAMLFSAMALRSARALPLAALVLLPLANAELGHVTAPWQSRLWGSGYSGRLRKIDAQWSGLALTPLILLCAWLLLRPLPAGFPPDQFPVAAYTHIPAGARLFAPDKFGGYLIYRSNGTLPVFFDGRSDLYGAEFLKQYGRMVQVRPGWRETWDSFGFTHALMPNDYPLAAALELIGWRTLYRDSTAVLLARSETQ